MSPFDLAVAKDRWWEEEIGPYWLPDRAAPEPEHDVNHFSDQHDTSHSFFDNQTWSCRLKCLRTGSVLYAWKYCTSLVSILAVMCSAFGETLALPAQQRAYTSQIARPTPTYLQRSPAVIGGAGVCTRLWTHLPRHTVPCVAVNMLTSLR